MKFEPAQWYHVYNRGNNRQPIFFAERNYQYFLRKMGKHLKPHCSIIAYCLMPNHFHWLIRIKENSANTRQTAWSGQTGRTKNQNNPLVQGIATLLSSYTQGTNKQESRTGSLFKSKTKAKILLANNDNYPLICFHYIHQNPLRAGIVNDLRDWPYSSYHDYANIRHGNLVVKNLGLESMGISSSNIFIEQTLLSLDPDKVSNLL